MTIPAEAGPGASWKFSALLWHLINGEDMWMTIKRLSKGGAGESKKQKGGVVADRRRRFPELKVNIFKDGSLY
jgi:hypothetical protein